MTNLSPALRSGLHSESLSFMSPRPRLRNILCAAHGLRSKPSDLVTTSQNRNRPATIRRHCSTFASANSQYGDKPRSTQDESPDVLGKSTGETRKSSLSDEHNIVSAPLPNVIHSSAKNNSNPATGWPVVLDFESVISPTSLKAAWLSVKSSPGMLTPGASAETLDKIDDDWFLKTSTSLRLGTFKYPLKRRKRIPKPGKLGMRPLTIINPRVKIIERAFLDHLQPIFEGSWFWQQISYETYRDLRKDPKQPDNDLSSNREGFRVKRWKLRPVFLSSSHGFRPNRSCHSALHSIVRWKSNTVWLLDYDIRKAFDNVNRNRLENIFKSYVQCDQLWQEIAKMMNAGVIDPGAVTANPQGVVQEDMGTPQGSTLSPLLFNVYMTPLDQFIRQLQGALSTDRTPATERSAEAKKAYNSMMYERSASRLPLTLEAYGSVEAVRTALFRRRKDYYANYGRAERKLRTEYDFIQYVRYADDFILGIGGSKRLALTTRKQIDTFLKSNLHLDVSHNAVVNRNEGPVKFLGFLLRLSHFRRKTRKVWNRFASIQKYKNRVISRLRISDARLANATVQSLKKNLINLFRTKLEARGRSLHKSDYATLGYEIAMDLVRGSHSVAAQKLESSPKPNPALLRWEKHFQHLFQANSALAFHQYHRQLAALTIPKGTTYHLRLLELRNKFIADIDELMAEAKASYTVDKFKRFDARLKGLVGSTATSKPALTEATAAKLAGVLAELQMTERSAVAIRINAPVRDVTQSLIERNLVHPPRLKPCGNPKITYLSDPEIITYYNSVMYGLLNYYSPASNFLRIKGLVEGLRRSCHLTLAMKHKKLYAWSLRQYGPNVALELNGQTFSLPSAKTMADLKGEHFQITTGPLKRFNVATMEKKFRLRLKAGGLFFRQCSVAGCTNPDIEVHHIRKLSRKVQTDGFITVVNRHGRRVTGKTALLSAINRKQIPLCRYHHSEFEKGNYSELNTDYLTELYNLKLPEESRLREIFWRGSWAVKREPKADPSNNQT